MVAADTIEEDILDLQERKKAIAAEALSSARGSGGPASAVPTITAADMAALFHLKTAITRDAGAKRKAARDDDAGSLGEKTAGSLGEEAAGSLGEAPAVKVARTAENAIDVDADD
jgi:hypothetical protein